jgi:hypothetical protein
MIERRAIRASRGEEGIALLISIFVLLLISVIAIALIVSSGTESALAGNYRSSTGVYYAAVAGLEEARSRLMSKNPSYFGTTSPGFLPSSGTPLAVGAPVYMINPLPSETVAPWDPASTYPDTQFNQEFASSGFSLPSSPPWTYSVWNTSPLNTLSFPGPLYKWVRINAVSEKSLNLLVAPYSGPLDSTTPVFYDGTQLNITGSGAQVLEITALAALPNGSQKLLQYLAAPTLLNLNFPAALILDGSTPQFTASLSPSFFVKGNDQGSVGTCNPIVTAFMAVGSTIPTGSLTNTFQQPGNPSGIPIGPPPPLDLRTHYTNSVHLDPDIESVTLSPNLQTVAGLNALVQTIEQIADATIPPGSIQSDATNFMPAAMSPSNPMTIVVNGNLTFNGWHSTGYGLLLVTGKFTYDPDASWNGIILVIGEGWMYSYQGNSTTTKIQGAVFLARTLDASGNPLPPSSPPIFTSPSGFDFHNTPNTLTNGIYYSSCWIQASLPNLGYKILSFHEISQ